jgi:cbb3-type cytochrome oxidase subunit 3
MKALVLSHFSEQWLTAIAFILFFMIFMGVIYFTYIRNNKSALEKFGSMPLDQGDRHE